MYYSNGVNHSVHFANYMDRLRKNQVIYVKADAELKRQLKSAARSLDEMDSQFVRVAIRERIARVVRGQRSPAAPVLDFSSAEKIAA